MNARILLFALIASSPFLHAGEGDPYPITDDSGRPFLPFARPVGWEIGVGVAPIFGAEVEFSDLGQWNSPFPLSPLVGPVDRFYDDGFNRVDATGNAGNLTTFWSYNRPAQYNPAGAGSISMSIFNSRSDASVSEDETGWGGEIFAYKELGELDLPVALPFATEGATWGVRVALHINNFSSDNSKTLSTSVDVTTDSFGLGGAIPPAPPFAGSPAGFGNAALGDQPARVASVQTATVSGSRDFDATLFGFSAGPYLEVPLANGFSVRAEAGLALAIAHGDYSFSSTTTTVAGAQTNRGSESELSLLPGLFGGLTSVYQLNPEIRLHGSLRYQLYDSFEVDAGSSEAELDLSSTVMALLGASYSF